MKENFLLERDCTLMKLDARLMALCLFFSCGNEDLDDFFHNDASKYAEELLGKTYCWVTDEEPRMIVAMFTLSNDSIKTRSLLSKEKNKLQRKISNAKRGRSYPATLIGRLGVNKECQGGLFHVGTQVMNFLKMWFRHDDNKTGCRFLVVDAYNNDNTIGYYLKNGFVFLHASEEDEKEYYGIEASEKLKTRLMYFDLKTL